MFLTMPGRLNIGNIVLMMFGIMVVAASMKKGPNKGFTIIAEAGRIEEPPLGERQTPGIFIYVFIAGEDLYQI